MRTYQDKELRKCLTLEVHALGAPILNEEHFRVVNLFQLRGEIGKARQALQGRVQEDTTFLANMKVSYMFFRGSVPRTIFFYRNLLWSDKEERKRKLKLGVHVPMGMMNSDSMQLSRSIPLGINFWGGSFLRQIFASAKQRDLEC